MLAMTSGGRVRVPGWPRADHPGRRRAARPARADGRRGDPRRRRPHRRPAPDTILGIDADLHDVGELAPAVAALCALAETPSRLRGIAHIRGHETDRLAALATELRGLGADVTEHDDGLSFEPAPLHGGDLPHLRRPPDGARRRRRRLRRRRACWSRTSPPPRRRSPASPTCGRVCSDDERALRRARPGELRAAPPAHPSPHQGPAQLRRRRPGRGGDRRPRPLHLRPRRGRAAR